MPLIHQTFNQQNFSLPNLLTTKSNKLKWTCWRVEYLANWSKIGVGVTLIWQEAVNTIHNIATELEWGYLTLA